MSGIYIHIPFCKQACHYCDFHFSTSLKKKDALLDALCDELVLRKEEMTDEVQTIYFGGGTPSLLSSEELARILETIAEHFTVSEYPEITLEANPDDLSKEKIEALAASEVNRLSIGVQSFFEEDLKLMNRAHNATEALFSITEAKKHFENISLDLIYGIPEMTPERWMQNVNQALALEIPHLSCYALTVEPNTALQRFIEKGTVAPVDDALAQKHHELLIEAMEAKGYHNYEFSNFGKPGFYSENNMAYWHGEPYLGIGPSAHSYDGLQRSWNVANNSKYIAGIQENKLPIEREQLSKTDAYNEYVMTRLRTMWGISLQELEDLFGREYLDYALKQAKQYLEAALLEKDDEQLWVTKKGKFLSDGISSHLFYIPSE